MGALKFSRLAVALSAVAVSLASPLDPVRPIAERGPQDFILRRDTSSLARRLTADYTQNYTTGGTVSCSPTSTGFSVSWDTQNDFVVGKGWSNGCDLPITFSGSFSTYSGTGLLSVYGWTTEPLVEYYIVENNCSFSSGGTHKGSFTSDGATYTVWETQQFNKPSILGTSTFHQYISIRSSPRTSGTVTFANHIAEWSKLGMNLGTYGYQVIAVEGWGGAGSAQQTVAKGGSTGPTSTTTSAAAGATTSGSSETQVEWGQCGGLEWTGPTVCAAPYTCQITNEYYAQCK